MVGAMFALHLGEEDRLLLRQLQESRREHLERDRLAALGVDRAEDPADRAGAEVVLDLEAGGDGVVDLVGRSVGGGAPAPAPGSKAGDRARLEPERERLAAARALLRAVLDVASAAVAQHGFPLALSGRSERRPHRHWREPSF